MDVVKETKKQTQEREAQEALETLRQWIKPGDTVYTVLEHVSSSGMTRDIKPVAIVDGKPVNLAWYMARLGWKRSPKYDGLRVGGCGMDMGFSIVYGLSRTLYADSFDCIGHDCPANDHSNGDRDYSPHRHSDGGYALRHSWL